MFSSTELQNMYNRLYVELRKYVWNIDVVESIAELEVACYTAFPSIEEVWKHFNELNRSIKSELDAEDDADLLKALEKFRSDLTEGGSDVYVKLNSVRRRYNADQ